MICEVSAITQGVIGNLVAFSSDFYPGGISFCIKPVCVATFLAVRSGHHPFPISELMFLLLKMQASNSTLLSQLKRNKI